MQGHVLPARRRASLGSAHTGAARRHAWVRRVVSDVRGRVRVGVAAVLYGGRGGGDVPWGCAAVARGGARGVHFLCAGVVGDGSALPCVAASYNDDEGAVDQLYAAVAMAGAVAGIRDRARWVPGADEQARGWVLFVVGWRVFCAVGDTGRWRGRSGTPHCRACSYQCRRRRDDRAREVGRRRR